jgi:hypothetical protein
VVVRDEVGGPAPEPHLFFRIQDTPTPDDDVDIPMDEESWSGVQERSLDSPYVEISGSGKSIVRIHWVWA